MAKPAKVKKQVKEAKPLQLADKGLDDFLTNLVKGDAKAKEYFISKLELCPFLRYRPINDVLRAFHTSAARIRGLFGGNRSGKTRGAAQEAVWWATGIQPFRAIPKPPVRIWIVSQDFPASRDIMQPLILKILGPHYIKQWYATDKIIELKNESTIGFKSNDSGWEKFQGTSMHLIVFDEEPDYAVVEECRMRIIDTEGSMVFSMTPTHGMSWVYSELYEPWEERTRTDIECFFTSTMNNPYIKATEIEAIKRHFGDRQLETRLHGKFVEFAGLIYNEFDRNVHLCKRFVVPAHWTRYRSIDPGINNPTACVWWAVSPTGEHYIYDEYSESNCNVETNARNIKAKTGIDRIAVTYIDPSACNRNPAHPELRSIRDEYSRFQLYCKPANNNVEYGINSVHRYLAVNPETGNPLLHIFDDCYMLLKELHRYRWDEHRFHKEDKNKKETPKKVHDHLMDAMRYIAASNPIHSGLYDMVDEMHAVSTRKFTKYG